MTSISALENIYQKGLFGDHEGKNEKKLIKIFERKNLLIDFHFYLHNHQKDLF